MDIRWRTYYATFASLVEKKGGSIPSGPSLSQVAVAEVGMIKFDILGPVRPVLRHGKLQPRLHVPIVVDDCCILDHLAVDAWVVT